MNLMKLIEIFDVEIGVGLHFNKMDETEKSEGIPYVSRSSRNNGVSAYVREIEGIKPNEGHTLSVASSGSVLETFYQPIPYYSGHDLYVLKPKNKLSDKEMLAYAVYIRGNKFRYNYGRQANKTLADIEVPSPQDVQKRVMQLSIPKQPSTKPVHKTNLFLNARKWEFFQYDDIFEIRKGRRLTKANMKPGSTPFIGSIDSNNGYRQYVSSKPNHPGNTITVNYNGSVAEVFYQPNPYWASDDVNVLYPKFELNPYIGLFLCTIIRQEKFRYSYGRKWHRKRMKDSIIHLPATSQGKPDWKFIEDYIKSLPCSSNL